MELKVYLLGGVGSFFKRLSAEVEYQFFKTSNINLVSKLVVFFTSRAVAPQTDVLLGKPSLFSKKKKKKNYMGLIFALHIELFYIFLC